jgi:large subunit ribosomal protein L29
MAILRIKDIEAMSIQDREYKLVDLRAELTRIRTMVNAGGAVENPTRIRELRKAIAQILTVQKETQLGLRKAPKEAEKKEKAKKPTVKKPEESSTQ